MSRLLGKLPEKFHLRTKILIATILVVGVFTGLGFYQILRFHTQYALHQVADFGKSLLENTYSAMKYPMSVGDSKTVEEQLKDLKGNMKDVDVFISDFRGDVTYASDESRIKTNMNLHFRSDEARNALANVLKTGLIPDTAFTEAAGEDTFLITMKPVPNESSCHHCHGNSQKVLGAMIVKQPVTEVYQSLAGTRNRVLLFAAVEIVGIILIINYAISRMVTRRIRTLVQKTGLVSAGDVTVEVVDDSKDSIGVLTRNFNQMVRNLRDRIEYANSLKFGISDPFFMVDPDMQVTYMNEAAAAYTGMRPEEVLGRKGCRDVFRSDACRDACPVREVLKTGEPVMKRRLSLEGSGGKRLYFMASAAALKDSTGKILGAFELMRDITKEVEADTLLQDAYHKEESAKKALREQAEKLAAILARVAEGDLTVRARPAGDDDVMDQLVNRINDTLNRMEDLITQTGKAAMTVIRGIRHISDENQGFAQRTQQQAATMEEISATVEQIISNIHQNASNTQRADSLSKEAVSVAQEGGLAVEKTTQAMADMAQASRKIVEMMDLINEITFQTNLLSINAAVEAARAGEQGRGFAVVANEVRNLAKRSSEASKDIQLLVRDIMDRVASSRNWVAELEGAFTRIIQTSKQSAEALTEVSYATQESAQGVNQIGQGIREMSDVIEHNASLVDQLAEAAEHLNEKASLLQKMTDKFVVTSRTGDEKDGDGTEREKSGPRIKRQQKLVVKKADGKQARDGAARGERAAEAGEGLAEKIEEGFEEF